MCSFHILHFRHNVRSGMNSEMYILASWNWSLVGVLRWHHVVLHLAYFPSPGQQGSAGLCTLSCSFHIFDYASSVECEMKVEMYKWLQVAREMTLFRSWFIASQIQESTLIKHEIWAPLDSNCPRHVRARKTATRMTHPCARPFKFHLDWAHIGVEWV